MGVPAPPAARRRPAPPINNEEAPVLEILNDLTAGRGPDACIDAVGMDSHIDVRPLQAYDRAKQAMGVESDRPHALREAIMACANGGVVSVIGVYGGFVDKFPMGSIMNRSLILRAGQCHVRRYMEPLMKRPWCRASTSASSPRRRHLCTVLPQFPERCSAMLR